MTARYGPQDVARLLGLPEPTAEQAAVIAAPAQPLAVIAGAGSGKSETMAARLVWLVANGLVRPDRVLGLTFTRKAAAELAERVRSRLDRLRRSGLDTPGPDTPGPDTPGPGTPNAGIPAAPSNDAAPMLPADASLPFAGDPVISTYHAYAGRLVADHALREGLEPSMRLITPAESWQLAARIVAAYDGPMGDIGWGPPTVTAAVLALSGELSEHLREPADVHAIGEWLDQRQAGLGGKLPAYVKKILQSQRAREQLLPLAVSYASEKARREVLDHGDQMALAARIASRHPEVGLAERSRYHVVLLDEYQDTSQAQLVLLRALFGGGHPVTAVGDPCQSIYGWRGASAGNLRRFSEDFPVLPKTPRPGVAGWPAPVKLLSTSFRNAGRVLDTAAVLQQQLRAEAPDVPRLKAAPDREGRGWVACALLDSVADEAEWVAGRVKRLLMLPPGIAPDGQPWPDGSKALVQPSDIAILCRKRSQFPALRRALEARDIPVEVVGLGGLLTVPEVQDVVATLRVLNDAAGSDSLVRLLTGPRWRIGPRDLVALGRRARALARADQAGAQSQVEQTPADDADALAEALTDLTTDAGSLVEALDDLGDAAAYSHHGFTRFRILAGELRTLRGQLGRPLPDLIGEVERTLGLDIELASRPGADPLTARADLDAFTDAADGFAGSREDSTLGAFLAYLSAAETEEFGLETGRVGETDSVKLATVHTSKGLQWAAVLVPGLAAGERSQVFPARPRLSTRWTDNPRLLPFALRGDATDLPALRDLDPASVDAFTQRCADRDLAEERRLMYVAATRAAFWLGCSGYWWGDGASALGPSPFLDEVRRACQAGTGRIDEWAPPPAEDEVNPALAEPAAASWPASPAGQRYDAVREGARLVTAAMNDTSPAASTPEGQDGAEPGAADLTPDDQALVAAWQRDAELLLAERERRRADGGLRVTLPGHLSVSSLVMLARDPAELARQVRRPMPRPPAPYARRGTAFHQWLEERFGQQRLIDTDDLFGGDGLAGDTGPAARSEAEAEADLTALREKFEASEWAGRWPREAEVPFETLIGDRLVRGRIDAVFDDAPDGLIDVVDWKTGQPPGSEPERHAVAVQLAAYRLAWAALAGIPVHRVRAAFHYVRPNLTVRPADLLDEAGLAALIEAIPAEAAQR
ncbi:MAG TPA: ATP-dependent DNA helicase [Streptosporangiaceae bacterium]|nr:ATP-dependent DNA helicase [Streptosporangiaceae bacterium]